MLRHVQDGASKAMLQNVRTSYDLLSQVRSCKFRLYKVMIFYVRLGLVRSG